MRLLRGWPARIVLMICMALAATAGPAVAASAKVSDEFQSSCGQVRGQHCTAIWTDRSEYQIGDTLTYCYSVPEAAHVTITLFKPDGSTDQVLDGEDDGSGDCKSGPVAGPNGQRTLRLDVSGPIQQSASTSYSVVAPTPMPVPTPKPVIRKTTKVLGSPALHGLATSSGTALPTTKPKLILTFKKPTQKVRSIKPGNVIVSGVTPKTPYGLLRKVTSVKQQNGRVVVSTVPASLTDAIFSGSFEKSGTIAQVCPTDLSHDLYNDNQGNSISIGGSLCFSVSYAIRAAWGLGQPVQASFTATATENAEMHLVGTGSLSSSKDIQLGQVQLPDITFLVGAVPVVIVPVLTFHVGFEGKISASVTVSTGESISSSAGVSCTGTACTPTSQPPRPDFSQPSLVPQSSASLTGYFSPHLELKLYDAAGPDIGVKAYLEGDADLSTDPWWTLWAGMSGSVGLRMKVLSIDLSSKEFSLGGFRTKVADAGGPLSRPSPSPTPSPTSNPTPTTTPTPSPSPTETPTPTPTPTVSAPPTPQRCPTESLVAVQNCYSIFTDKPQYTVGDTLKFCYTVPGPAHVRVTDLTPDGKSTVVLDGDDDGTGDCKTGQITPPLGKECLRLDVFLNGNDYQDETCFQVVQAATIKPGGVWISPANGQTFTPVDATAAMPVTFSAHAYPATTGAPPIDHVNFTIWWPALGPKSGPWITACTAYPTAGSDIFTCTADLRDLTPTGTALISAPPGALAISFDVYDTANNRNLSPNGERTIYFMCGPGCPG